MASFPKTSISFLIPKWISQELETQQKTSNDASAEHVGASGANNTSSAKPEDKKEKDKKPNATSNGKKDAENKKKGGSNAN